MGMGQTTIGVRYDDETRTVVSVMETEEIMTQLRLLHKWYKEGIINADAATLTQWPAYMPFFVAQGWPNAWRIMDEVAITVPFVSPIFSNSSALGSLNSVYAGTKHPEKVLEFLQLVNTDTKLRDMLCYGEEGVNFEYVDGMVKTNTDIPWPWPRYTQGNHAILSPNMEDPEMLVNMTSINETAENSVMVGFRGDRTGMEDQLAYLSAITAKYQSELFTGTSDPDVLVPQMMAELRAGGFDELMKVMQAQVDAAFPK